MTHLDTLKAMRDAYAQLEEPNRLAALDAAIAAMERLARVRAAVEALPPAMPHDRAIRRAAVLALLEET